MLQPLRAGAAARLAGGALTLALLAGCSASTDYEAAPVPEKEKTEVPRWIRDGVRIARATKAARSGGREGSGSAGSIVPVGSPKKDSAALPPRAEVVTALTGAGLTEQQAGCVYDNVAASPETSGDLVSLMTGLGAATAASSTAPLQSISPEAVNRVLVTVLPCLDQGTILSLLAAGQGLTPANGAGSAVAALLKNAQGLDVSKLVGADANQIAQQVAGALGADQVQQVQNLLAAVGTAQQGLAANLAKLDPSKLDLSKLDLKNITKEQLPILVLALLGGLTAAQQSQLSQLVQVNLSQVNINVDPDKLTPDEVGSLLLILAPVIAGAIKPTPSSPPAGEDPNQIYIPTGADLSNINPLLFLNRNDVIAQFANQGVNPVLGTCIFDGLSRLSAPTLAAFFTQDGTPAAIGSVLLVAISCVVQQR